MLNMVSSRNGIQTHKARGIDPVHGLIQGAQLFDWLNNVKQQPVG